MKRLIVLVALLGILGAAMPRVPHRPTRSATSPSITSPPSTLPATASTCATRSTWPRSRPSRRERRCGSPATPRSSRAASISGSTAKRVPLTVLSHRTSERPGAGGLTTMRFDAVFRAAVTGRQLTFADHAYGNRIGWREIVVTARSGARVDKSSAPATSRSDELRAYPQSLLRSPLDMRSATVEYTPGSSAAPAPAIGVTPTPEHRNGGFESLIQRGHLSLGVILLSLLIAAFWGAVHALTPGHGKALVAGYLVGTQGQAAARVPARRDRDRDAHRRRLRPRTDHAPAVAVHRPRPALPLADAGLGAARRRRRSVGAPAAATRHGLGSWGSTTTITATITITTTATSTATPTITTTTTGR